MNKTLKILVAGAAIAAELAAFCAIRNDIDTARHKQKMCHWRVRLQHCKPNVLQRARKTRSQGKDMVTIRLCVTQRNYPVTVMQAARWSVSKRTWRKSRTKLLQNRNIIQWKCSTSSLLVSS